MKKIFALILTFFLCSCLSNKVDDPLIVPPNFAEMPDLKNPEKENPEQKDRNVARLKELLLQSD